MYIYKSPNCITINHEQICILYDITHLKYIYIYIYSIEYTHSSI